MIAAQLPATDKLTVGRRLRLVREALDLSRREVCDRYGYGITAWDNYENGVRAFDHETAIRFVEGTGITFDWLYRGRLEMLPSHLADKIRASERV